MLREIFGWFATKADVFADKFVGAAGTATGTAAGVGAGAAITGQLPRLVDLISRIGAQLS